MTATVPGNVRLARHVADLDNAGHDAVAGKTFINVKIEYGAAGDGVTDDTAAIQLAIDDWKEAGATIFFPRGTYLITAQLDVDSSASTAWLLFLGEGGTGEQPATTILMDTANTTAFKSSADHYVMSFQNICIKGPGSASSGAGIWGLTRNVHTSDVRVEGFFYGIRIGGFAFYSTLRDTVVYNNASHGIWQESGSNNMTVDACHVTTNGGIGIKVDGSESTKIVNGAVEGNGSFGISVEGSSTDGTYIAGVYFEANGSANVMVGNSGTPRGTTIIGCFFTTSTGYHIDVKDAGYITIGANDFLTGGHAPTKDIRLQTGISPAPVLFNNRPSGAGNVFTTTPIILEAITGTLTVKDEGTPLATGATSLDFVGPLVTASGTGAGKTVTVTATLDDLTDVTAPTPATNDRLAWSGSAWINDARAWRPLMDGLGNVVTDSGTGEAIAVLS